MASERKERRHLTTLELDDLAWSVRRFEEQSKRDGNKKRDCDRAQRLRVLLGKLDNALIPPERRAMASERKVTQYTGVVIPMQEGVRPVEYIELMVCDDGTAWSRSSQDFVWRKQEAPDGE